MAKIYFDAGHGGSDPGAVKYVKEMCIRDRSETLQNSWGVLQLTEKAGSRSTAKEQGILL